MSKESKIHPGNSMLSKRMLSKSMLSKSMRLLAVAAGSAALSVAAYAGEVGHGNFQGDPPQGSGGGERVVSESMDSMSETQRQEVWSNIRRNARKLPRSSAKNLGSFAWPMAGNGLSDPGYHAISNFVDQDGSGYVLDYNCGARTYNGHRGTDYYLWPFSWYKMDNNQVRAVAAAPGTIVYRSDGNYDRSCSVNGNNWNAVYVQHGDGSVAWYGHLKNGSLTAKGIGATVVQGEVLGVVGSSGSSTEPHLHFEVYDANGNLINPYAGSCNALNLQSAWTSQRAYYDSAINKLMTGSAAPNFGSCPNQESPNEKTAFRYGETVYFSTYYRDQLSSQQSQYRVLRPNGTVHLSWTHNGSAAHYPSSWWYWYWTNFAASGPSGTWKFEVIYNGQTYSKNFTMSP